MIDDCTDIRFLLMLFRRGELDAGEAEAVRSHLAQCPDCAAELEAERELDRQLAHATASPGAPPELQRAVSACLARERRRGWGRALGRRVRQPLVAAALGAAAALLVVTSVGLIAARGRHSDPLAPTLAEVATAYRRCELDQQLERARPGDLAQLLAQIQQRLDVPTTTAFRGDPDLMLVAADPTYALGRPGAILVFRSREGQVVTLQIVRAPEFQIPRDRGTPVGRFRPVIAREHDLSTALWKQGNALYALSAPVDKASMADIYLKVRLGTSNP